MRSAFDQVLRSLSSVAQLVKCCAVDQVDQTCSSFGQMHRFAKCALQYHNRDLRAVSWQRVAEVCGSTGMIPASKSPYFVEKAIISPGRTDTEFCYHAVRLRSLRTFVQYPTQSPMCHSMVPIVCLLYAR